MIEQNPLKPKTFFRNHHHRYSESFHFRICLSLVLGDKSMGQNSTGVLSNFMMFTLSLTKIMLQGSKAQAIKPNVISLVELWYTFEAIKIEHLVLIHFWYSFDTFKSESNIK